MNEPRTSGALDRREAVPALIGDASDLLLISGLAGPARDVAALTGDGANSFTMAGAMGGATMIGLGLALARPDRRVVVVTGDGELLMNLGSLAVVAAMDPPNLVILCVDNALYQETGSQASHTGLGTDLAAVAAGCGIRTARTLTTMEEVESARPLLRTGNGAGFLCLKVGPEPPPKVKRSFDAAFCRARFRDACRAD